MTAHKRRELVLSGDEVNGPMHLRDSEVNHLRRLLAWMRVTYMLDPDVQRGYLCGASEMAALGLASKEDTEVVVQKAVDQITQVPGYVRQGVKMLTKALRMHDAGAGIVEEEHATAQTP